MHSTAAQSELFTLYTLLHALEQGKFVSERSVHTSDQSDKIDNEALDREREIQHPNFRYYLLLLPFYNVRLSSIVHIRLDINESRHIYVFRFIPHIYTETTEDSNRQIGDDPSMQKKIHEDETNRYMRKKKEKKKKEQNKQTGLVFWLVNLLRCPVIPGDGKREASPM
jgi:hypothetical protein